MAGFCEHGSEPSGSIKYGEFLEQLRDHQFFKDTIHAVTNAAKINRGYSAR
jgi:hypothetical protein